jgi:hypothetical protein
MARRTNTPADIASRVASRRGQDAAQELRSGTWHRQTSGPMRRREARGVMQHRARNVPPGSALPA